MTSKSNLPDDVLDAMQLLQETRDKVYLSRQERENIHKAKLRIAYYVCRSENIVATRENLAYILGSDADDIMRAYDKYLETTKEREQAEKAKPRQKPKTGRSDTGKQFWGEA